MPFAQQTKLASSVGCISNFSMGSKVPAFDVSPVLLDRPDHTQPSWMDMTLPYGLTLPGFPDFVTPEWFHRNAYMSSTAFRRLRDVIAKRRRSRLDFLPWLPANAAYSDFAWVLTRAAIVPGESVSLCDLVSLCCKSPSYEKGTVFERLFDRYYDNVSKPDVSVDLLRDMHFAVLYENGVRSAAQTLQTIMEFEHDIPEQDQFLVQWCLDRHPECYDEVDAKLAANARKAQEKAALEAVQVPVARPPAPVEEPAAVVQLSELEEALNALQEASDERDALMEDLEDLTYRHAELQRELAAVRAGHDPRKGEAGHDVVERLPTTMAELVHWMDTRLPPNVHVLPRAFRSLKKAPGLDVERLAKGLRFLRDVYVPFRSDEGVSADRYREELVEAGFVESASFASASSLEAFAGYKAQWNGSTIHLDRHLKRGIGTDPRTMIRVYFTWDRATRTVVIGHMPGHLDNWLKN